MSSLLAYGPVGLFIVAFTESTVFPIPPDVILLPLAMMNPRLSWWYAFLTSAASVLGGLLGYAIGRKAGRPILRRFFKEETIRQVEPLFVKYGGWAVGIAAFTPLPFKIFTFGAGIFRVPVLTFTVVSTIGRSARFFLEAALVYFLGDRAQAYLGRNFELATLGLTVILLLITWLLPKMLPSGEKTESGTYDKVARTLRKMGTRTVAWGAAAAVFGIAGAALLQDVMGPERHTLNAALGWAFTWFPTHGSATLLRAAASPWVLGALGAVCFATQFRSLGRDLARFWLPLSSLPAAALAIDASVRHLLPDTFAPFQLFIPYLPLAGLYLLLYRPVAGWRRAATIVPGILAAAAVSMRSVADGMVDPACATLSLAFSALMFCLTMSLIWALPTELWPPRPR